MKKRCLIFLAALLLLLPAACPAEGLPDFLGALSQGLSEGLSAGGQAIAAGQELTLALDAQDARIEEGHTLLLTITAGNPYPHEVPVTLTLALPGRLSCAQPLEWDAQLSAAQADPVSGEIVPSATTFTREVTLLSGGESESAAVQVEMNMGTRFYRANAALDLCVPRISAKADVSGAQNHLVTPGGAYAYEIEIVNDGDAPKDVTLALTLPQGVTVGALPTGFTLDGRTIRGAVRAEIAAAHAVSLPVTVDKDALEGDEDAALVLSGALEIDGERVALPMVKAVGAMIHAKLIPQLRSLEEGGVMDLSITVVNTGLSAADVEISCLLPDGLTLLDTPKAAGKATEAAETAKEIKPTAQPDATDGEAAEDVPILAVTADDDALPPSAATEMVISDAADEPTIIEKDGALRLSLHMDAAKETEHGLTATTHEVTLRVRADAPIDDVSERLLGATLAWKTGDGETQLGEAVALRVYRAGFLGMSQSEWNGILLAALLMMITVCCLYSAVKAESKPEEYCFE